MKTENIELTHSQSKFINWLGNHGGGEMTAIEYMDKFDVDAITALKEIKELHDSGVVRLHM